MSSQMSPTTANALCVTLLVASCCVMTGAWYLHLRFKERPMWQAILFSWLIAGGEYCLQVPANRIGHGAGGLSAAHLRAIAEVAILLSFLIFQRFVLHESIKVNHVIGFVLVLIGVCVVLFGPFDQVLLQGGDDGEGHRRLNEEEDVDARAIEMGDAGKKGEGVE